MCVLLDLCIGRQGTGVSGVFGLWYGNAAGLDCGELWSR